LRNIKAEKDKRLSIEETNTCIRLLPAVAEKIGEHGFITDLEMDDLGVPNNMNTNKDNVVMNRCRSSILTHRGFIEKEVVAEIVKKKKKTRQPRKRVVKVDIEAKPSLFKSLVGYMV
jgi:hypothetical protein